MAGCRTLNHGMMNVSRMDEVLWLKTDTNYTWLLSGFVALAAAWSVPLWHPRFMHAHILLLLLTTGTGPGHVIHIYTS